MRDEPSKHEKRDADIYVVRAGRLPSELRALSGNLKRRLREQAPPGHLTWAQVVVLGRLERDGPATLSALALARAANMRSQSVGAIVAPLEKAGLVAGAPDPSDCRQTILSLTEKSPTRIRDRTAREDLVDSPHSGEAFA